MITLQILIYPSLIIIILRVIHHQFMQNKISPHQNFRTSMRMVFEYNKTQATKRKKGQFQENIASRINYVQIPWALQRHFDMDPI